MNIKANAKAVLDNTVFAIKKHSPEILTVLGFVSLGYTIYSVRKAAKKEDEELAPVKEEIKALKESDDGSKQHAVETVKVYAKCVGRVARIYKWAGLGATLTTASFLSAKKISDVRYGNLSAAYTLLQGKYKELADKVTKECEKPEAEKKDSDESESKTGPSRYSPYSFFFDEASSRFTKSPEINRAILVDVQSRANDIIRTRAHLNPNHRGFFFLEELYKMLDIPPQGAIPMKMAKIIGWVYDENSPVGNSDNFIDLGIDTPFNSQANKGLEPVYILNPNVDGNVWNLMSVDDQYGL